jgi:hypothetical protein
MHSHGVLWPMIESARSAEPMGRHSLVRIQHTTYGDLGGPRASRATIDLLDDYFAAIDNAPVYQVLG